MTSVGWIVVVVVVYMIATRGHRLRPSIVSLPVFTAPLAVALALVVAKLDVAAFESSCAPLTWMLGPATTAFAVPIYAQRARIRAHLPAIVAAVTVGVVVALLTISVLNRALDLPATLAASLLPKSVTTPIAVPLAVRLGGTPALTVAAVLVSGVLGMVFGGPLLTRAGVTHPIARGLAIGTCAHGFGTSRAIEEGELTGAMSGVAMVLAGIITAILLAALPAR